MQSLLCFVSAFLFQQDTPAAHSLSNSYMMQRRKLQLSCIKLLQGTPMEFPSKPKTGARSYGPHTYLPCLNRVPHIFYQSLVSLLGDNSDHQAFHLKRRTYKLTRTVFKSLD